MRVSFANQNLATRFTTTKFAEFHQTLVSESVYSVWQAYRVASWNQEDWRLFVASRLFSELQQYEGGKQVFGWQRESTDLATILEALFTAEGNENTEIGYRLRKRLAVLLSKHVKNIEKDVKELYKQRTSFVHGSFFQHIYKETKITNGIAELPHPPFAFLYGQKENVRRALVAYLYLNKIRRADSSLFPGCASVLQILEGGIIDTTLRSIVDKHTTQILNLL